MQDIRYQRKLCLDRPEKSAGGFCILQTAPSDPFVPPQIREARRPPVRVAISHAYRSLTVIAAAITRTKAENMDPATIKEWLLGLEPAWYGTDMISCSHWGMFDLTGPASINEWMRLGWVASGPKWLTPQG